MYIILYIYVVKVHSVFNSTNMFYAVEKQREALNYYGKEELEKIKRTF